MGCKQKEQTPEESEIYLFFYKMMKETEFNYTIKGYEENYDKISQLSKNRFKKLEKKQNVRIGFVKEVMYYINKINIAEKEDHNTHKVLFCTLILTLTLKYFLKENSNNYNFRVNNDLQQSLLTMAVQIYNHNFQRKENLKLVIYYLGKMLVLLFKEMNDINQYINIERFIDKLNFVSEDSYVLKEEEKYNFIKINLACIGEFFARNYKGNDLKIKYINIIIDYFMYVFWVNSSFIEKNYDVYKKEIFSEKYLFNINEIIIEKEKENEEKDLINRKKSLQSIKLVNNLISKKSSILLEKAEVSISAQSLIELRKNQSFVDLNQINENFYFFFKSIISDISNGKEIFNKYFEHINDFSKNKKENGEKNQINKFKKTNEILLLLLFVKCKINSDNVIIYSFIEFEGEYIEENFKKREVMYEFVIIFFELFKDEKDIYQKNLKLLSQIFLIEIENLDENEQFLIENILKKTYQYELFISFISILIQILKEDEYDTDAITFCLEKLNKLIIKGDTKNSHYKINKTEKYILQKEEFGNIIKFINLKIKDKDIEEGKELFNANITFFSNLLTFIDNYFSLNEVYEDITCRNLLYKKIISAITKLQMINIGENENEYIEELMELINHLINIIKKYTLNFFDDFEIIHKYLSRNLNKIAKIEKEDINIINYKLIYSTSIFIISQLKVIYGIPTSIINLHKDIIETICKSNNNYKEYFEDMNINEYQNYSPKGVDKNNKFYKYLSKIYSHSKNDQNNIILLTNNEFKYLINILQNKLYGKKSPLIIYYKSQGNKKKNKKSNDDINENFNFDDFDELVIEEERNPNDTLILSINESNTNLLEMSLRTKKIELSIEDDISEENSFFNDNSSQNINLPEKDEEYNMKKIEIVNDLDNSFKEEKSMDDLKI